MIDSIFGPQRKKSSDHFCELNRVIMGTPRRGRKKKESILGGIGLGNSNENEDRDSKRSFGIRLQKRTYDNQKGKCARCGKKVTISHMEFHHVKSWSKGGKTTSDNCTGVCLECHKDIHDEEKIKEGDKKRRQTQKDGIFGSSIFRP